MSSATVTTTEYGSGASASSPSRTGWVSDDWTDYLIDTGILPDWITRRCSRFLLGQRVQQINEAGRWEAQTASEMSYIDTAKQRDATTHTDEANQQHYEVPTEFLRLCLGKRMKYSACLFPPGVTCLDEAEVLMFEQYCNKAGLQDGQMVLDLGCGWGSLTLYLAEKYPKSTVHALSNSRTQRMYIEAEAKRRDLQNIKVFVGDVAKFEFPEHIKFDRVLSIEMLEHVRNHERIFEKVSRWLTSSESRFFVHVFCHRTRSYDFETEEGDSWMARHFFTGGCMPSEQLFMNYQKDLRVVNRWSLSGMNYAYTSEAWLANLDKNITEAIEVLRVDLIKHYMNKLQGGSSEDDVPSVSAEQRRKIELEAANEARVRVNRWRVFYIAVAEEEWGVVHYLFAPRKV
ncbi:cyclopropane-fatty-acyl-phospholipid synthase superfamily [Syncephalis plumigaleata]|nr:cyclopropane-fatty-acyl-phospholipid synthase superfamily [Syncephalis plumigaleata]